MFFLPYIDYFRLWAHPSAFGIFLVTENCGAGETAASEGTGCDLCIEDTYKPTQGRDACTECPEGTTTDGSRGAETEEECLGMSS